MKKLILLVSMAALVFGPVASSALPGDTVKEAGYTLSSRNAEAQSGKYRHMEIGLAFNPLTRNYTLDITSARDINTYLEISDQDENVIFFKPVEIRQGRNRISFVAEDGQQSLFRLAFAEASGSRPAVFIIRETGSAAEETLPEALR